MSLRSCSRSVFTAFRRAERCADRATGAAGPVFVTIGAVLLSLCVFTFCA
jgi:palmitoyltransferase